MGTLSLWEVSATETHFNRTLLGFNTNSSLRSSQLAHSLCYNLFHEGVEKIIVTVTGGMTIPKTKLVGALVEIATSMSGPLVNILFWLGTIALAEM